MIEARLLGLAGTVRPTHVVDGMGVGYGVLLGTSGAALWSSVPSAQDWAANESRYEWVRPWWLWWMP